MPPSRYARKTKTKIPRKFYIASEGTKTEPLYFNQLKKNKKLENTEIINIKRDNTNSSPENIVSIASDFCKKREIKPSENDIIAIVIDYDRWKTQIPRAYKEAKERKYEFYVSNPCIELWFILHKEKLNKGDKNKYPDCKTCKQRFNEIFKGNYEELIKYTNIAIKNSEALSKNNNSEWPNTFGTNLHKLLKKFLSK